MPLRHQTTDVNPRVHALWAEVLLDVEVDWITRRFGAVDLDDDSFHTARSTLSSEASWSTARTHFSCATPSGVETPPTSTGTSLQHALLLNAWNFNVCFFHRAIHREHGDQLLPLPHTEIIFTFQHQHTEVILQTEVDLGLQKVQIANQGIKPSSLVQVPSLYGYF